MCLSLFPFIKENSGRRSATKAENPRILLNCWLLILLVTAFFLTWWVRNFLSPGTKEHGSERWRGGMWILAQIHSVPHILRVYLRYMPSDFLRTWLAHITSFLQKKDKTKNTKSRIQLQDLVWEILEVGAWIWCFGVPFSPPFCKSFSLTRACSTN